VIGWCLVFTSRPAGIRPAMTSLSYASECTI
jgi:hypothetical protein